MNTNAFLFVGMQFHSSRTFSHALVGQKVNEKLEMCVRKCNNIPSHVLQ